MMETKSPFGSLYIVGTPIGNLEDMTLRAIQTLKTVDWIAAEDTRHTGKLLKHFEIGTPQLSYHRHNHQERSPQLIEKLQQGASIALVSDAGMPCISDPGFELVALCVTEGIEVIPIPGVTAAITGLAIAGLTTDRFTFEGFLPTKNKLRTARLAELRTEQRTMVFYESPHDLIQTLKDFGRYFGPARKIAIARELTKLHEQCWRGNIEEAQTYHETVKPRGEYTLIVAGDTAEAKTLTPEELIIQLQELLAEGLSKSQASRHLAKITHQSRQEIYQLALSLEEH